MEEILKILVVDDDEVDRMAVRRSLKTAGVTMQLIEAYSCESALAVLQHQNFDCIFLDYRLPDGDGLTLVEAVKSAGIKVPMVVLTGQGDEQTAVELMKAGASDYISKSKVSSQSLSRSLHNAIRIHRAEMQAAVANQLLKESEERYRFVLEGSNDGIWDWDLLNNQVYWNDRCFEITGLSKNEFTGTYQAFCGLIHPNDRPRIWEAVRRHLEHQTECNVEFQLRHRSGEYRYCVARGKAQRDATGKPFRMSGIISDITERKQTLERERFLAEASALLSSSLDYQATLERLAQLAVPYLADLCLVDVVETDGLVHRVGAAHADRTKESLVRQLKQCYAPQVDGDHPAIKVLHTGKPELVPEVSESLLICAAQDTKHLEIIRQLEFKSYMVVPLIVRERTFGAISLVSTQSWRSYSPADLAIAEEIARRAALSVENGQLYREATVASENLRQAIIILGEQQQQLRTLQQLTNLLNQRLSDLPALLRVMVGAVCDAIAGAQFCVIILQNSQCDGLVLTVTAGVGTEKLQLDEAFSNQNGFLAEVFSTGESLLIQNDGHLSVVKNHLSRVSDPEKTEPQPPTFNLQPSTPNLEPSKLPASIYAVAIESVQAGRLGILAIGNWEDPKAFDEEDCKLLTAVGEQAAIAIENARMISTLEERENRLAIQNEILGHQNQELENLSAQIQLQNLQLMEAARMKSQFLATMSHELRTPMNAVIGFSQLLLRQRTNQLSHQQLDMVERIYNNGKHLLALINDILDLSKIEAGRLELQPEEFDIGALVRATTEELRSLADEKRLTLHVETVLQNSIVVNDSARVRQILVNLLSNAIKFTDTGSVWVELIEKSPTQLMLTVKDTGIGIADENIKHIFEEFRQVDQSLTKKYAGTGLGLAITDSLVRMMKGTISVESQLGQGSTFRVELPRQVSP